MTLRPPVVPYTFKRLAGLKKVFRLPLAGQPVGFYKQQLLLLKQAPAHIDSDNQWIDALRQCTGIDLLASGIEQHGLKQLALTKQLDPSTARQVDHHRRTVQWGLGGAAIGRPGQTDTQKIGINGKVQTKAAAIKQTGTPLVALNISFNIERGERKVLTFVITPVSHQMVLCQRQQGTAVP